MTEKFKRIRTFMDNISVVLEFILAIVLIIAIITGIVFLKTPFLEFIANASDSEAILTFLTYVLNIAIAVELFKVLCSPGIDTILDVMMFVIVRHMIVHDTTAVEDLLTIIGVILLILVKKYLHDGHFPKRSLHRFLETNQPEADPASGTDEDRPE